MIWFHRININNKLHTVSPLSHKLTSKEKLTCDNPELRTQCLTFLMATRWIGFIRVTSKVIRLPEGRGQLG